MQARQLILCLVSRQGLCPRIKAEKGELRMLIPDAYQDRWREALPWGCVNPLQILQAPEKTIFTAECSLAGKHTQKVLFGLRI